LLLHSDHATYSSAFPYTTLFRSGAGAHESWTRLKNVKATEAELFADRAAESNRLYTRYRKTVHSIVARAVSRQSHEVRIGREHRWGPEPFHHRDQDYNSIVKHLLVELAKSEGGSTPTLADSGRRFGVYVTEAPKRFCQWYGTRRKPKLNPVD